MTELVVHVEIGGTPVRAGIVYFTIGRKHVSTTFVYDSDYLSNPAGFDLGPALPRQSGQEYVDKMPGSFQDCSPDRGNADREYRAARTVVAHYEDALELARADVAAFGLNPDGGDSGDSGVMTAGDRDAALATAREALAQARAVAEYAPAEDPRVRDVLRELVAAVHPILARARR